MGEENISENGSIMNVASPTITTPMEDGKPMDFVGPPAVTTTMVDGKPMANPDMTKKKNRTKFRLLKVAVRLFQPAPRPDKKQAKKMINKQPEEVTKPAEWEKYVGSMRPLHLQENLQSPSPSVSNVSPNESPRMEDGTLSEMNFSSSPYVSSPSASSSSKRSDIGTMSQYNSAVNLQDLAFSRSRYNSVASLQDLDTPTTATSRYCSMNNLQDLLKGDESEGEEKDPDEAFESITGDDMIDSKADEFIAKFYHVMSLERSHRKPRGDWRL